MFYDATYILVIIGAVICMAASANVNNTYSKYAKVRSSAGLTGRQVAEYILDGNNITNVSVQHISGQLTDHYDPSRLVVNLSDAVYNSTSVAAIGVAAHECGHVLQHQQRYLPLTLRTAIVPAANIGSRLAWPLILIGLFINASWSQNLIMAGILLFSLAVLFQLVTLPVEFDASASAMRILESSGILNADELPYTGKVLRAAALTYVASAAASLLQLLRLILIFGGNRRRD